jgi:hypothetical protein
VSIKIVEVTRGEVVESIHREILLLSGVTAMFCTGWVMWTTVFYAVVCQACWGYCGVGIRDC